MCSSRIREGSSSIVQNPDRLAVGGGERYLVQNSICQLMSECPKLIAAQHEVVVGTADQVAIDAVTKEETKHPERVDRNGAVIEHKRTDPSRQ